MKWLIVRPSGFEKKFAVTVPLPVMKGSLQLNMMEHLVYNHDIGVGTR
jgi:hypothetical protein